MRLSRAASKDASHCVDLGGCPCGSVEEDRLETCYALWACKRLNATTQLQRTAALRADRGQTSGWDLLFGRSYIIHMSKRDDRRIHMKTTIKETGVDGRRVEEMFFSSLDMGELLRNLTNGTPGKLNQALDEPPSPPPPPLLQRAASYEQNATDYVSRCEAAIRGRDRSPAAHLALLNRLLARFVIPVGPLAADEYDPIAARLGVRDWRNDHEQWPPNRSVLTSLLGRVKNGQRWPPYRVPPSLSPYVRRFLLMVDPSRAHGQPPLACADASLMVAMFDPSRHARPRNGTHRSCAYATPMHPTVCCCSGRQARLLPVPSARFPRRPPARPRHISCHGSTLRPTFATAPPGLPQSGRNCPPPLTMVWLLCFPSEDLPIGALLAPLSIVGLYT